MQASPAAPFGTAGLFFMPKITGELPLAGVAPVGPTVLFLRELFPQSGNKGAFILSIIADPLSVEKPFRPRRPTLIQRADG